MKQKDIVNNILHGKTTSPPREKGTAYAPTNIALCKYWGKRDVELNLPVTSSLSVALAGKGSETTIEIHHAASDLIILNNKRLSNLTGFVKRLQTYLDLFRPTQNTHFKITINCNIPIAAGLASSACGFASMILALNNLFDWQLTKTELSLLARLGSGSACRSLWHGFVLWQRGELDNGMDSVAEPLNQQWPELRIGLLLINQHEKSISSRDAMQQTVNTSPLYTTWPDTVKHDLEQLLTAIKNKDFDLLGQTAESNAIAMHATMQSANPPITYSQPATLKAMQTIWQLRRDGLSLYFTQDAGPNLKLLFLQQDEPLVRQHFMDIEILHVGTI